MRKLSVLGCTGSIGKQTLQVAKLHPDQYQIVALCAHKNSELLFEQARETGARVLALTGGETEIPDDLKEREWYFGPDALEILATVPEADSVVAAVVGVVGLKSVVAARKAGKKVLLANKETLVSGGELVMQLCKNDENGETLLPVDSEHSAIWQCIHGEEQNPIYRIWLTASGGPFRTWDKKRIMNATVEQALGHPTWNMGQKITIDSASMFNKALEIIEAKWLFGVQPEQIQVAVHPQSIIHSMVEFEDGAVKAQLGAPDMRVPILYAMTCPDRMQTGVRRLDFDLLKNLEFFEPDLDKFPAIRLAYEVLNAGGAAPCILNAANEVAAWAFLDGKIRFGRIYEIVESVLQKTGVLKADTLEAVLFADQQARSIAESLL